ncbi:hypothetical protein E2C01_058807 [Portunus trituberculatus]|uniref:Uncharacterized protein n=1 Tax=Portunus trituberculatus TaxID=210409 RepID=A0A5B7H461_PORTR|nr:hypothetical protein [Portunus trituberculatus]
MATWSDDPTLPSGRQVTKLPDRSVMTGSRKELEMLAGTARHPILVYEKVERFTPLPLRTITHTQQQQKQQHCFLVLCPHLKRKK